MTAAVSSGPVLTHVHAALHCNVNSVEVAGSAEYWADLGFSRRMHQVTDDLDGTPMGLPNPSKADTWFLYDARGPRSAPAIELVQWTGPLTIPRGVDDTPGARGFAALGIRVASFDTSSKLTELPRHDSWVRGQRRSSVLLDGPDGPVEVVVIDSDDPADSAYLSHVRMRSTDLAATVEWYSHLGWQVKAGSERSDGVSLVVAEDPTFSLEFDLAPDAPASTRTAVSEGLFRIALAVEDVPGAVAVLRSAGLEAPDPIFMSMPDIPTGGFSVVFLADPDGAVVELVSRPRAAVRRPSEPA